MINLRDICYCRIGVSNINEATLFAAELLGLDIAYKEPRAVYFKSDDRDHTLVYFDGEPKDHTVAFEVTSAADLDAAAAANCKRPASTPHTVQRTNASCATSMP